MALFNSEDNLCHLFLPTLINVLFVHKPVRIWAFPDHLAKLKCIV